MQKSKLLRSLCILNAEEMKGFYSFLQSPYFNTNSNIVKLHRVLHPYHPDFQSPKLDREKVFQKIFPGKAYAHQQMLNLMSEVNGLLEQFLVLRQMEEKEFLQQKLLLEAYAKRPNSYTTFLKKYKRLEDVLEGLPYRDAIYFQEKMELSLLYYDHPNTQLQKNDKGTLFNAMEYFEAYKKLTSIKLKCAQNARQKTIQNKQVLQIRNAGEEVLLNLYMRLEKFQRSEKEENFNALLNEFESSIQLLRNKDKSNVLKILTNYCTRQTNSGHTRFFNTLLKLYKLGLETNCIVVHDKIGSTTFHNIVSVGAICKDFDWTEEFIENFQMYLEPRRKVETVSLALGGLLFEKKEYDRVIEEMQCSFKEPMDVIKSKALLIRSWFELWMKDQSYFDFLATQLETFEKFIRRDQSASENLKSGFLKFIGFTKKILSIERDKKMLIDLYQEIEEQSNLVFKKWLFEKIEGLK